MVYYIHENIIKDTLYNKKKEKIINNINESYTQLKNIFSKMSHVSLSIIKPSNVYRFIDNDDSNFYTINNLLNKLYKYINIIDNRFSNDSDLMKLKKDILNYLDEISRSTNIFSNNDIKIITNAMNDIISEYNNNSVTRNKAIKSIFSNYNGPEDPNKIKFICVKILGNKNNQLFRVVPKNLSKDLRTACVNVMQDMADKLYNKIKDNINTKYINCNVWDSDDESELLVGCIIHN